MLDGATPDYRRGREIYRGPASAQIVLPGWAAYLQVRQTQIAPAFDVVEVMFADVTVKEYWYVGQLLPVNSGCGYGDTLIINSGLDQSLSIWAYPSTVAGREQGFDEKVTRT